MHKVCIPFVVVINLFNVCKAPSIMLRTKNAKREITVVRMIMIHKKSIVFSPFFLVLFSLNIISQLMNDSEFYYSE